MAKKYKKNWGSTYQVRFSKKEKREFLAWINRFDSTHREVLLTVMNVLGNETLIKNGEFYTSLKQYAHFHGEYKSNNPDKCELCEDEYRYKSNDSRIFGHHHNGYDDENIDNVKWVCRRCHGFLHRDVNNNKEWNDIIEVHKKWDGKTADEQFLIDNPI